MPVLFLLLVVLAVVTSWIWSARLAAGSVTAFFLGLYVLTVAQAVVVTLALSPIGALNELGYLAALSLLAAASLASLAWRPATAPPVRAALRRAAGGFRDPVVATMGVLVAAELAYAAALGALTPPTDDDGFFYHLQRAALWLQNGGVSYLDLGEDVRLSAFPPNAELVSTFVLGGWGGDRIVAWTNIAAPLALTLAVAAIARRLGLGMRESLFGALVIASVPIVMLQASSTLTDLQVAALITSAAALVLSRQLPHLLLAGVAAGLALGMKVTGIVALPVLAAIALWAWWPRWRPPVLVGLVAVLVGSYWYVVNLIQTGSALGRYPENERGWDDPVEILGRFTRQVVNLFDAPGSIGNDRLLYPAAGLLVAVLLITLGRRLGASRREAIVAGLLVAAAPLVLELAAVALRLHRKVWVTLGRPDIGSVDMDRDNALATTMQSGAGIVGIALAVAAVIVVAHEVRAGRLRRSMLGFALAPFIWLALLSIAVVYFRWNGRFLLPGFAIAAGTWGLLLRIRWLAWATVGVTAVTLPLVALHAFEKPLGPELLEPTPTSSILTRSRCETVALREGMAPVLCAVDEHVPGDGRIAHYPYVFPETYRDRFAAQELMEYALFGPRLGRHVTYATTAAEAAAEDADWYLAPTESLGAGCANGWREVYRSPDPGWSLLRRAPAARC